MPRYTDLYKQALLSEDYANSSQFGCLINYYLVICGIKEYLKTMCVDVVNELQTNRLR